jgi:hypothetical protein
MSRTFTAAVARPIEAAELRALGLELTIDGALGPEHAHVFRPGESTRALELTHDGSTLAVRILAGSCAPTYALAFDLIERLGGEARDTEGMTRDDIAEEVAGLARMLVGMAERDEGVITLSGPRRPFFLGPRVAAELRATAGPLGDALTARMRETQWACLAGDVHAANVLVVGDRDSHRRVRFAVWSWGARYLLPDVDAVQLHNGADALPIDVVPEVAAGRARFLDERHLLIDAFTEDEWPALLARARPHAVDFMTMAR